MQDNYNIDEQFINQGWEDMERLLDQEMPVQRKKRRLLAWWWWGTATAATIALLAVVVYQSVLPNEIVLDEIPDTKEIEELDILPKPEAKSEWKAEVLLEEPIVNTVFVDIERVGERTKNEQKPSTLPLKTTAPESENAQHLSSIQTETMISKTVENSMNESSAAAIETIGVLTVLDRDLPNIERLNPKIETLSRAILGQSRRWNWRHGLDFALQTDFLNNPDAQLAFFTHLENRKWRFSAGLGVVRFSEKTFTQSQNTLANPLEETTSITETEITPELDNAPEEESEINNFNGTTADQVSIPRSTALALPIEIAYRMKRWQVFGSWQTFYTLSDRASLDFVNMDAFNTRENTPILMDVPTWRHQFGTGIGYDLTHQWNIQMSYQHELQQNHNGLQLSLQYYFH